MHGDIDIIPAYTAARWEIHGQQDTALILSLPPSLLNTVAEEHGFDSHRMELRNRFQIRDAQLENIGWALKTEMEANYPSGRLYVESLAVSVASRLVSTYSSIAQRSVERNGGLGGRRLKQTLAYIEDHLAEDVSLPQLASIAGISASHFKTLFRESAGAPLHQYVIQRRLDRAKSLLMARLCSCRCLFAFNPRKIRHLDRSNGRSHRPCAVERPPHFVFCRYS